MDGLIDELSMLIERGGYVMVPLLALSVISLALIVERWWFWAALHTGARRARLVHMNESLRRGERASVGRLVEQDRSLYAAVVRRLLDQGPGNSVALEAVDQQRPRIDRFMVMLSTIITAAPLLGILGTVIGIIRSFNLLGEQRMLTDTRLVATGIAEALLTTALGLVVALVTLFPYMAFRKQADRALGRMESLIASAQEGFASDRPKAADASSPHSGASQAQHADEQHDAPGTPADATTTAQRPAAASTRR